VLPILLALFQLGAASGSLPAPAATSEPVADSREILEAYKLTWRLRPTAADLARHFPENAMYRGVEGRASILCLIGRDQRLMDCKVETEEPEKEHFGFATTQLAPKFLLEPQQPDGRDLTGRTVRVSVTWRLPRR
jgi:hypothetical protein